MPATTVTTATRRLLRSPLFDVLVGPHGVDRYLELIKPDLTVHEARAEVLGVRRQTPRSVTLSLRPNGAWRGFKAGQFVRVGVEIDGVRRTRTYSPASSEHDSKTSLELTATSHPEGLVSSHLRSALRPGAVLHLGQAEGAFVLPGNRPDRLVLVSGGSGITPVISMLRTLHDENYCGEIAFLHYARTASDWLYPLEVQSLASKFEGKVQVSYVATREGGQHLDERAIRELMPDLEGAVGAVCGPPSLIDAMRGIWDRAAGVGPLLSETFTPPSLTLSGAAAEGTVRFLRSGRSAQIADGSLLEQAEAAGLSPEFGCRMGICHTCTCRKSAGAVRNVLTGEVSGEEDEDIQLCISVPVSDVALEI